MQLAWRPHLKILPKYLQTDFLKDLFTSCNKSSKQWGALLRRYLVVSSLRQNSTIKPTLKCPGSWNQKKLASQLLTVGIAWRVP